MNQSKGFEFPFGDKANRPGHLIGSPVHSSTTNDEEKKEVLLFTPIEVGGVKLKNRIVVSPMCQYTSEEGFMNDWHLVHLGGLARGGAGLVFCEAISVSPEGRLSPWDAGIYDDAHIPMLKRIVTFIHSQGALAGAQLAHGGPKANLTPLFFNPPVTPIPVSEGGWEVVGPTNRPWGEGHPEPHMLTVDEIQRIVGDFVAAAGRALEANFDIVEIHGAHGYLLSSFNSPAVNHRTDEYGGSFENRTRLFLEVVRAVRKAWPRGLWVRMSTTDWLPEGEGWDIEQTLRFVKLLKEEGVDLVDCSSGGNHPSQKIPRDPNYQVQYAKQVKEEVPGIAVGAVGLIIDAARAEEILQNKSADVVVIGRALLYDPHWPLRAAEQLKVDVYWPLEYERAKQLYARRQNFN